MFDPSLTRAERLAVLATYAASILILGFLVLPIVTIIPLSFTHDSILSYPVERWSLRWYKVLWENPIWGEVLKNSLVIAVASTIVATALGTLASIGLTRRHCPAPGLLTAFLLTPMIVPVIITGVASYFFYTKLGLTNSFTGMILAHSILGTPFVVITVTATLQGFDQNQRRAAYSLGARPWFAFTTVIMPQIAPGILSGALFAFITSFDEVIVALFIAGTEQYTLPRQMFSGIRENLDPTIAAVATVMITVSIVILALAQYATARGQKNG
ncbi:spermidine/putrescine transport system permease protein PotC (plasmid) [Phaeobacter inhibens]|uniref:Spermidine/putrescine transport system permease protein PotC n=1 Tax=Phaeobacter inhibens TaxID=221822 RepID=A0ABN5GU26_9RHOB|nr:ABC transporter permease [Phaeobacter inhibens]AUQ52455.1 spermidine/putrescine transport system permease protein PotC [Phaeobacter inhibens]AUQ97060.1 spermidine/putrescine transport system permease protein PotC [Phaeobacter inhibens]AUR22260.1 spermidine/putrescine transport system permease protein PotC [Phaeobacter inhibens]